MNIHTNKTQENKSQLVSNEVSQKQNNSVSTFQFVDNRPESITQRRLTKIVNNTPQVRQLRTFQEMTNNSHQNKQADQLLTKTLNYSTQQQDTIQKKNNNVVQFYPPKNFKVDSHFEDRMGNYSISENTIDDIVDKGSVYDDTQKPGVTIYYKDGIAVVYDGSQLKTCYPGKVKSRWTEK